MKTRKILTISVLALGLMVWPVEVSEAVPMGTAFTYQGRLIDANEAADGEYDFEFTLYDANTDANQIGWAASIADVDVVDGYFTVELFLGSASFDGDARWLEIGVRPGEQSDPCEYTILSPRQEVTPTPYAIYARMAGTDNDWMVSDSNMHSIPSGNVGIGTAAPQEKLTVVDGTIKCTNSSDGGWAVHGEASGWYGQGVYGYGTAFGGRGVYGKAGEDFGMGVYGNATAEGQVSNWGGYFEAAGDFGTGVFGTATATGDVTNYGGYFKAAGDSGRGVYGEATDIGNVTNYGGYFVARSKYGRAVYGEGTGESARGVWGETSGKYGIGVQGTSLGDNSFGVYGFTSGSSGRGVCGNASNTGDVENYGGYFTAAGDQGRGVYGKATGNTGVGVYGKVTSESGVGVHGEHSNSGNYGYLGSSFCGVRGVNNSSGNFGYLGTELDGAHGSTSSGNGVYGYSHTGHGVHGSSSTGYAGYFNGKVHITGTLSKGGGLFKIDHPLDPENKYLSHSFVESPDMMNIYNGNVVLDKNGQASVQLPEYFEALNRDLRYQLTAIGTPAPNLYIAEEISNNRFKIAGGKKGTKVSWQVTGIRQDAYAKANRIVVEENKSAEENGYYLHPAAYGLPEEKGIEALHNARFPETRQVAKKVD